MNASKYLFEALRAIVWYLRLPLAILALLGFLVRFYGTKWGWF